MKAKIAVTIVDDHPMVISGLKNMLVSVPNIQVINAFPDGTSLLEGLKTTLPDVLLLDVLLPGIQGQELAQIICQTYPRIGILAISSLNAPAHIKAMMRAGCRGYLLKNTSRDTLIEAIETVYRGAAFVEPELKEQMLRNLLNFKEGNRVVPTGEVPALTRREKEVLQLIIQEYSNQEIADKLFLSLRTVENHRFNLQQKLQVKNSVGLVKIAIQMGLVSDT